MTKQHLQSQEVLPCLPLQDSLLPFQRPTFLSVPFMGGKLEDTECSLMTVSAGLTAVFHHALISNLPRLYLL